MKKFRIVSVSPKDMHYNKRKALIGRTAKQVKGRPQKQLKTGWNTFVMLHVSNVYWGSYFPVFFLKIKLLEL